MNKNVIILIIILLMLICLSVIVEICIYGNEAMFIADYMPGPGMENKPSFEIVRAKALLAYIIPIFIITAVITLICLGALLKKQILKRDKFTVIYIIITLIIPTLVAGIKLFNQFAYTC